MQSPFVTVSYVEVSPLLTAKREKRATAKASPDLGRSIVEVSLSEEGVLFPNTVKISWEDLAEIASATKKCFRVSEAGVEELRVFSEETQWVRSLWPTGGMPASVVAGFPMHRIQGIDPKEDTLRKVGAAAPIQGEVLDTATCLGYTAIYAAQYASHVTTIELDPSAISLARLNPWSQELFDNPKITQLSGDAVELVKGFSERKFARIIHDPPTFKLGGELYSLAFYRELYRILQSRGKLFHYIGDPQSDSGKRTTSGVVQRLLEAGFQRVLPAPKAFGVVAIKG